MSSYYQSNIEAHERIKQYHAQAEKAAMAEAAKEAQAEKSSIRQAVGQAIINIGQKIASVEPQKA